MTFEPRRRASDIPLRDRVTVLEVDMRNFVKTFEDHVRRSDDTHDKAISLSEKLDGRVDKLEVAWAKLTAVVGVAILAGQLIAPIVSPIIGRLLGLPTSPTP